MFFKIKNLFFQVLSISNGTWKQHEQNVIACDRYNLCYFEMIDELERLENSESYPNKKAFYQLLPYVLQLKSEIVNLTNYQFVLTNKIQQIEKYLKKKNYVRATHINKKTVLVNGRLLYLSEIAHKLTVATDHINIEISDLTENCDHLHDLYRCSKVFACVYKKNFGNYKLKSLKEKIFDDVSHLYSEQNFCSALDYLSEFIENTNFATCEYKCPDGKIHENYYQYNTFLDRENESNYSHNFDTYENYSEKILEKQKKWCNENGWTDWFFQDKKWYAFAPSAVIPQEIPCIFTKKEILFTLLLIIAVPLIVPLIALAFALATFMYFFYFFILLRSIVWTIAILNDYREK